MQGIGPRSVYIIDLKENSTKDICPEFYWKIVYIANFPGTSGQILVLRKYIVWS